MGWEIAFIKHTFEVRTSPLRLDLEVLSYTTCNRGHFFSVTCAAI